MARMEQRIKWLFGAFGQPLNTMTKTRFSEILKEYKYSESQIDSLWNTRPTDYLDETRLRETAKAISTIKDELRQA